MLKLNAIELSFGAHTILRNLSCEVEKGDFVVIVGGNGAGKSTLFDTIAGRIKPQQGIITINGHDVTALNEQQRACMVTRIFQNTRLNSVGGFTVHQNLAMAHYSRRSARLIDGMNTMSRKQAEQLMDRIGMPHTILDKKMRSLSGGQRQLIAFVMATQLIPQLLLLDEPTAALDPQSATTLLMHAGRFIKEHSVTTIMITHDPYIALNMGNKIWVLEKGVIARQFSVIDKKNLHPDELIGHIDYQRIVV